MPSRLWTQPGLQCYWLTFSQYIFCWALTKAPSSKGLAYETTDATVSSGADAYAPLWVWELLILPAWNSSLVFQVIKINNFVIVIKVRIHEVIIQIFVFLVQLVFPVDNNWKSFSSKLITYKQVPRSKYKSTDEGKGCRKRREWCKGERWVGGWRGCFQIAQSSVETWKQAHVLQI